MSGFGRSMIGTQRNDIARMKNWMLSWEVFPLSPHIGLLPSALLLVLPILSPTVIIVEIIDGAHIGSLLIQ
jgi:hypothetical protein